MHICKVYQNGTRGATSGNVEIFSIQKIRLAAPGCTILKYSKTIVTAVSIKIQPNKITNGSSCIKMTAGFVHPAAISKKTIVSGENLVIQQSAGH